MNVLFYDIDNNVSRELRFYNTQTESIEIVNTASLGNTDYNFQGRFVHAWQSNDITFRIFRFSPSGNHWEDYNYKTLLKTENSPTPGLKRIHYYDQQTKEFTYFEEPYVHPIQPTQNVNSPAENNFSKSTSQLIQSYCIGTTKKEDYHNGLGGITSTLYENSSDCGFVAGEAGIILTEQIPIVVDHKCYSNPVLIRWLNDLGGWDNFMFSYNQEVRHKTTSRGTARRNIYELDTESSNVIDFGKDLERSIIAGAEGVSLDDYNAIVPHLFYSKCVYIVQPLGSGKKDIQVTIKEATPSMFTRNNSHSIQVEIILPEYFI